MTCTSISYLSNLRVSNNSNYVTCNDKDDNEDTNNFDDDMGDEVNEQELAEFNNQGDKELKKWFAAIKYDPLICAQSLVQL
jgi:hypothetical protein